MGRLVFASVAALVGLSSIAMLFVEIAHDVRKWRSRR